jgi:hypothetical protein
MPAAIGHRRSRTANAASAMLADRNKWCPIAPHDLAVEPALNFQWAWSSGPVAGRAAAENATKSLERS